MIMIAYEKDLTIIDLYSGAGGLSLGASRAGFNVSCAIDSDVRAMETHSFNFPNTKHLQMDLTEVTGKDILLQSGLKSGQIYGIVGGPPCQGFSTIGRRKLDDSRNSLFIRFFEIVNEIKPKFFLAENVLGILNEKYTQIRKKAFSKLSGYTVLPPIKIKASDCGAPTIRTRVFFVGVYNDSFKISKEYIEKYITDDTVYVKDALLGLPQNITCESNNHGQGYILTNYFSKQTSFFHKQMHSNIPNLIGNESAIDQYYTAGIVTGCLPTKHSVAVTERYRALKHGQMDIISKSIRLNPDGFCPTLRAGTGPEKGSYQAVRPIHYALPRVITPREAARLQGFPDWFVFHSTIWHSFRQIGNSVSPIVAEKILSAIRQKLT